MDADRAKYLQCVGRTLGETDIKGLDAEALFAALWSHFSPVDDPCSAGRAVSALLPTAWRWLRDEARLFELRGGNLTGSQVAGHWQTVNSGDGFARRVAMHYHADRRLAEMSSMAVTGPRWQTWKLYTVGSPITPPACAAREGQAHHFESPVWLEKPCCWRPDCSCRLARARNA